MKNKITPWLRLSKRSSLILASGFALAAVSSARAQNSDFAGTVSSDPTNSANYSSGTAPFVTGGTTANIGNLSVNNASANHLIYTSALGTTTLTASGDLRVGDDNNGASEMDVTGGNLTITTGGGFTHDTLGYRSAGTLGISGGTFTLGINNNDLWLGNNSAGTVNVSGSGVFNLADQLLVSRDGGAGNINVSGNGIFNAMSTNGTVYGTNTTGGLGLITLTGSGIYEQTGSGSIALGANFKINFGTGSLGRFSLLGASTATLDSYISAGDIEINGATDMTLSDYMVTGAPTAGSLGTIQLPVPEPGTWAMALVGVGMLVGVQRVRARRA